VFIPLRMRRATSVFYGLFYRTACMCCAHGLFLLWCFGQVNWGSPSKASTSAIGRRGDQAGAFKMWELLGSSQQPEPRAGQRPKPCQSSAQLLSRSLSLSLSLSLSGFSLSPSLSLVSLSRTGSYGRSGGQILNPSVLHRRAG